MNVHESLAEYVPRGDKISVVFYLLDMLIYVTFIHLSIFVCVEISKGATDTLVLCTTAAMAKGVVKIE